ncbi:nitrophenyl compound nitroreductase subunit ArsF family protein [Massilibacteroides sp.]|uniref:nitrophenyl compound nitroreductase subunit ArsF family protein n=1 Tax=Massilibacteroides sp. TaxID=2034766 RepID=UPI002639235D|nr:nitrophenyl compound nitroreductase subunit ArsF family protein [Massilibacteroides sp.]MDD4515876.1 nitrophenyl compound nitroreductase subunit ArsF family protein [Massilibacteroides sp.]
MKNVVLALLLLVSVTACNNQPGKKTENKDTQTTAAVATTDTSVVNVYYFHGKQRCKTCVAVGDVAKETIEKAYVGNSKVVFTEINTSEDATKALIEKYEVTWNALIIARGSGNIEITKQAFATAVENPQSLETLIKDEVNKRLQ